MSETPTHAAVPTPASARPQHTDSSVRTERGSQSDRTQQAERHVDRTQHTERLPEQGQRQQTQAQHHVPSQHTASDRTATDHTASDRTATDRTSSERAQDSAAGNRTAGKLEDEWKAVQYDFVDDPKSAVRKADQLVTRAIEELTARHRSLTEQLEGNRDPQTEDLRLALHRYRELFKSLVAVK
ncbi:hypothetical protein SAMN05216553_116155 [Lentzea fradiae]|uniref:Uncharacterized protein n=1 Tax=Lentzea fradiae TaxID=200378 RepID=A0A1G7ZXV2_9PSEU|nr:hypothetical protein [Lentzea fradiae]SDH13427.1 hypothetical protein SAMN05216553_116155 [Lentzea fradiae]